MASSGRIRGGTAALLALATVVVTLGCAALAEPADARQVRVFAVGPKLSPDWLDTRAHYRDKLFALVDRRRRRAPAPPIQRGADDVASHLLGPTDRSRPNATARDLVTLPEDVGLVTLFTGPRGAAAREVTPEQGLTGAVIALVGTYQPVISLYTARYPSLATRPLPTRALALALTDVFGRVGVETFAALADRYDVYLEAGVNMARRWRIVCADRSTFRPPPTGERCAVQSPTLVQALRDPGDPARDYAYQATTPEPVNMALVFGPDGRLVSRQVKAYLTPTELPEALDLVPGDVSGLGAVRTPVGTLGFVTSKDAWMPDVTAKLDARHVDLLVQPEFFVNDTVAPTGMWAPDTLIASGWSDVLRHPSIEALVLPEMTGNLIDNSADAQQHIVRKPRGRAIDRGSLVGQPLLPGFARVQGWVVPDPRGEPFPVRRRRLGLAGRTLLPLGDGPACPDPRVAGPCRNGQVEGVIRADVDVPRRPAYRPRARRTAARERVRHQSPGQPDGPDPAQRRAGDPGAAGVGGVRGAPRHARHDRARALGGRWRDVGCAHGTAGRAGGRPARALAEHRRRSRRARLGRVER